MVSFNLIVRHSNKKKGEAIRSLKPGIVDPATLVRAIAGPEQLQKVQSPGGIPPSSSIHEVNDLPFCEVLDNGVSFGFRANDEEWPYDVLLVMIDMLDTVEAFVASMHVFFPVKRGLMRIHEGLHAVEYAGVVPEVDERIEVGAQLN